MAKARDNGSDHKHSVEISDAAIEQALERILELEKPYFNPAGRLADPDVGREPARR